MKPVSLYTMPNAITLFRLVLFAAFTVFLFQGRAGAAIASFVLAWALDGIDGVIARKLHQESELGSQLDKFVDRAILGLGILFLIRTNYLPAYALLLLTKDFGLLPALTMQAARGKIVAGVGAGGKLLTFLQGAAIVWLLLGWPAGEAIVGVTAVLGGVVAVMYLRSIV